MALHRPFLLFSLLVMVVAGVFHSCKIAEKLPEEKIRPVSAVRLYKKALDNSFDYHHLSIRKINVQVDNGETRTTFRAGLEAIRGESILFTVSKLNLLVARIWLTPDSVTYINYFDRSWYAGGYEPFSRMLGLPVDFQSVQAIISADIFSLFDNTRELREYSTRIEEEMYVLEPQEQEKLTRLQEKGREERTGRTLKRLGEEETRVVQTFFFDPKLVLIRKIRLEEKLTPRMAEMRFGDYEQISGKYYPAAMDLEVTSPESRMALSARMSGFSTENSGFVPPKIPEKYQRVFLN